MKGKSDSRALNWIFKQTRGHRGRILVLVLCDILSSLAAVGFAVLSKSFLDSALAGDGEGALKYAVVLAALLVLQISMRILSGVLGERLEGKLDLKIKNMTFKAIMKKRYENVSKYHTGELLTRIFSDTEVVCSGIADIVPNAASVATRLIAVFAAFAVFDIRFVAVFLAAGVLVFCFSRLMRAGIKKRHRLMQEANGRVRSFMQESSDRLLLIKIFGGAERSGNKARSLQLEHFSAKMKRAVLGITSSSGFFFLFRAAYLGVLIYCASLIGMGNGVMTFGTMTAMLQLVSQVQQPFVTLSGIMPKYYQMISSAERLLELLELPEDAKAENPQALLERFEKAEGIAVENVSLDYGRGAVLKNASVYIKKDSFTLISGATGSGKTTLFMLLLGIYSHEGTVRLSGGETLDEKTRGLFAYVPQGNLLFSGSIRENLSFTREAQDSELTEALRLSCALDFVQSLPQGIDTEIGERGHAVSEGQAQRLAVARALLSGAPVLLLDEATSALDEETERALLENLKSMKNKTVLLISHKQAAREYCDSEIAIKDGVITQKEKK